MAVGPAAESQPEADVDAAVATVDHEVILEGDVWAEPSLHLPHAADPSACDAMGCAGCDACGPAMPHRTDWFSSAELLLFWRRPQELPALVTTSDAGTGFEDAGVLGLDTTSVLFGQDRSGRSVSAGGRFTIGRWLDPARCNSMTARFWLAGDENDRFSAAAANTPILARPVFQTDLNPAENSSLVIAQPDRRDGRIDVQGLSEVYGADVSLRQLWRQGLGGRIDFIYGYQFLRINESLGIRSLSQVTGPEPDAFPVGTTLEVSDHFDVENEFHGGHFGFSGYYAEGRWTLDGLMKWGFGNVSRRADLRGQTRIDGVASPGGGLLVRDSNAGRLTDNTFGWVPEFNINLGYHWRPGVNGFIGYSVIGLTDALQPWRAIDSDLRTDLDDPPTEPQRNLSFGNYWVQGINFGVQWHY